MTKSCYKTHREDPRNFPKIDAVATSQLLRGNTKRISNQYPNKVKGLIIGSGLSGSFSIENYKTQILMSIGLVANVAGLSYEGQRYTCEKSAYCNAVRCEYSFA